MNLFNDFLNTISDTEVTTTSAIFKLMLSLLLGGIVGFERKRKGQVAGARTFALISMGALGIEERRPGTSCRTSDYRCRFLGCGSHHSNKRFDTRLDHSCRYLDGGGFGFGGRCRTLCYCDYFDRIDIVHVGEFGTI